jgi:predicted nucleic acid-binding protein
VITAFDTNVLLDVFGADPKFSPASSTALRRFLREGALVASELVWAEAATMFGDAGGFLDAMRKLPVSFSPMTEEAAIRRLRPGPVTDQAGAGATGSRPIF